MADTARFVQFLHPGGEHSPSSATMPWNMDKHRRKFLHCPGRYVTADDHVISADLVFWGEWEPPSRVEHRWQPCGLEPRTLHRPYWFRPAPRGRPQNTDPWVFGGQMLYSNCQQGLPSMRTLSVGSVICFGSKLDHAFRVDTVFVIASSEPWTPAAAATLDVDDAFKVCTGGAITAGGSHADAELTLYRGAGIDDPVHGMYSFVPARPAGDCDPPRFARPRIDLPELINPGHGQGVKGPNRPLPLADLRDAWQGIRRQVLDACCVLAVQIDTPPEEDGGPAVAASSMGKGCAGSAGPHPGGCGPRPPGC